MACACIENVTKGKIKSGKWLCLLVGTPDEEEFPAPSPWTIEEWDQYKESVGIPEPYKSMVCFGVRGLEGRPQFRDDGGRYFLSYVFLAERKSMAHDDWSEVFDVELLFHDMTITPFPPSIKAPEYHARGVRGTILVSDNESMARMIGRSGWRIRTLAESSAVGLDVGVRPSDNDVVLRKKSEAVVVPPKETQEDFGLIEKERVEAIHT